MTTVRVSFSWKHFLYGILFGLLVLGLTACSGAPRQRPDASPFYRLSTSIGTSDVKGVANRGTPESDSLTGRGMNVGLRGEVVQPISYLQNMEVGLRVGITGRDVGAEPEGVQVDAESGELSAVGVVRGLMPLGDAESVAFYAEGFAGYAHNWGTVQGGPVNVSDDGGGLLYGAGAGLDFRNGLTLGLEWSRRDFDIDPVEIRADDIALVLGVVIRF